MSAPADRRLASALSSFFESGEISMRRFWQAFFLAMLLVSPCVTACGPASMNQESAREQALREAEEMGGEESADDEE